MKSLWILFALMAMPVLAAEQEPAQGLQPISIAEVKRADAVDFEREILPMLKNNCLACHNQTKAKADLILETPQTILRGGESGPAVVPGKSAESLLLKVAAHQSKPAMPPRENKVAASNFNSKELGLLKLWIDQGANGEVRAVAPLDWQAIPDVLNPIYAVALSQDGQFAACSRANQIFVYHVPSRQLLTRLIDPGVTNDAAAAHRDLVQSLAFNPDGTLLASGSYREVKLWRRPTNARAQQSSGIGTNAVTVSRDGKWLATVAGTNIVVREISTATQAFSISVHDAPVHALAFSPNAARLFVAASNTLSVIALTNNSFVAATNGPNHATAVASLTDTLFAAAHGDNVIRLWQWTEGVTNGLVLIKDFAGYDAAITSLEALPQTTNQFVSGSVDGTLRHWQIDKAEAIKVLKHEGPITAIAVRPDGKRFASTGLNKVAKLWNAEDGKLVAELKGDRYAQEGAAEAERTLSVAASEVGYHKTALEAAEKQNQTQTERLKKAEEAFAAADKNFTEKKQALAKAGEAKSAAEKTLADLNAEIKKVTDDFTEADKLAKAAASEAKAASERATHTKLAADQASQTKSATEKVASDAAQIAAVTKAAADTNAPAKILAEAEAVAAKARAFADTVASDAVAKLKAAEEAKAAAERAIDLVASRSFAAGQLRVAYDKTTNSAPQRTKEATDQLTTTSNALVSAEKEFRKTELPRSTSENELQLARNAAKPAADALSAAKTTLQSAEADQKAKDALLQAAKKGATDSEKAILALAFSPDNATLATAGDDQRVHTWSADNGAAFEVYASHTNAIRALAFLGAAKLASASENHSTVWDLNPAWSLERSLGTSDAASPIIDRVMAVRFSRDGQRLATGSGEPSRSGEIKIWQVADGKMLSDLKTVHSDTVLSLDFSPDDKYLASGAADKFARVIELATGKVIKAFEGHTHHVLGVSWKRDGRSLATAGADNIVKVWDFTTGERKKNIEGFSKEVASVSFIGATDQAVTSSGDSQVRIVRENGENVRTFSGAADFMYSASATPDGKVVVAGGQDSVLRIWNGADGNVVATFPPPSSPKP